MVRTGLDYMNILMKRIHFGKLKKILSNLIITICLCSFCFFSFKIYNYIKEEKQQENLNDDIIDIAVKKIQPSEKEEESNIKNNFPIEVDFEALKNKNEDIIAWIYSEGTPINYPIVQAKDNDYYLRRLIDGTYNQAGTLFMDYRNNKDFNDFNTIVYGHNMKNDRMFGTLTNYENQNYYNEHKEMFLYTDNKKFKVEIFAGFTTSSESDIYIYPKTRNTNKKLIDNALKESTFSSDVEVTNEDKILTLSTCSSNFENARYVILGVLKEVKN